MKFLPDVILCHPSHIDYPLWRKFIHDNRDKFNKVIVIFTRMNANTGDYAKFVNDKMFKDNVACIDNDEVRADQDWRDVAVNKALKYGDSQWVWLTEQDFFPLEGFWEEVEKGMAIADIFCVQIGMRLHPCCIFAKRNIIDKTSRYFGVVKDKLDHFGKFQEELNNWQPPLTEYGINPKTYYHMNGLSQNIYMLQKGEIPNFRPKEFQDYCKKCLKEDLHPDFEKLFKAYLENS